jgi:hypothetical protein
MRDRRRPGYADVMALGATSDAVATGSIVSAGVHDRSLRAGHFKRGQLPADAPGAPGP